MSRSGWFQLHNSVISQGWEEGLSRASPKCSYAILTVAGTEDLSNMEGQAYISSVEGPQIH